MPKSKVVPLKKKYKIKRKVKEHHKKINKMAKKNPYKRRLPKDPGIPNIYPFKGKLLDKLKENIDREKEDKKRISTEIPKVQEEMERLRAKAERKQEDFDNQLLLEVHAKKTLDQIPDTSRRTFFREFKKVITTADVILEVLDARDPLGCRCPSIEKMILKKDPNKKIVLVLNKIDLVPKKVAEQWLKYFRNEFPTVAFKCSTQTQKDHLKQGKRELSDVTGSDFMLKGSECLGSEVLLQLLKNYCRNKGIKTAISVGIIGYPNVGKSSLINSLKRKKVATVGSTPGVTTDIQEISLDKQIKLLDCPGIVFATGSDSNSDVVLRNSVKIEQLDDPIFPVDAILKRCHKVQLLELYKIPNYDTTQEFLSYIAKKRGKLTKGGIPNYKASAVSVLKDWNSGKIRYYTMPPEEKTEHISATVVTEWAKEFDFASVINQERMEIVEKLSDNNDPRFINLSSTMVDDSHFTEKIDSVNNNNNQSKFFPVFKFEIFVWKFPIIFILITFKFFF
eukprot:TRINITY_DN5208_c0_g2_i1.p1 TRINITY_DN5208_c0_g2~~TRINITY_DN5208_c0_g2_i1.p1  ORF type:complete len:507 (-),score=146.54 TRINITY_DN5208_c0_g2_i1:476-1996(-)